MHFIANCLCSADDAELCLMRGEYEMELSLSAEATGNLNRALSHVMKAVGRCSKNTLSLVIVFLSLENYHFFFAYMLFNLNNYA